MEETVTKINSIQQPKESAIEVEKEVGGSDVVIKKCRYYNKGYCKYAKKCRYFHPKNVFLKHMQDKRCFQKGCSGRHPEVCKGSWVQNS